MKHILLSLLVALAPVPVLSHELWLEALEWQVAPGDHLRLHIRNGETFAGVNLAWFDTDIDRLDHVTAAGVAAVTGRMGDIPAITVRAEDGLNVVAYLSTPARLTYAAWDKFANFLRHKDALWVEAAHDARSLPRDGVTERYTRHAKALVAVGPEGADVAVGLETEFVALAHPAAPGLTAMPVQLLYQGQPRADAQVEIFDRAPDGTVTVTLTRTDAAGLASVPVQAGHTYLLDAVVLRPVNDASGVQWHSLWAALTFAVPG